MRLRLFSVIYRHCRPLTTWGEEPGYEGYPEDVKKERIYGRDAGRPTEKVHLRIFAARDHQEVIERCRRDSLWDGEATQILCIWEGVQKPIYLTEHVWTLPEADEREVNKVVADQLAEGKRSS